MRILADVGDDEIVSIHKKPRSRYRVPAFDCIGGNMEYHTQVKGYDNLYTVIQNMSKQTAWLWWELVKNRNRFTNEAIYVAVTPFDKRRLSASYKELRKLNLVCRMRKQRYLINPLAYLPEFNNFKRVTDNWSDLMKAFDGTQGERKRSTPVS